MEDLSPRSKFMYVLDQNITWQEIGTDKKTLCAYDDFLVKFGDFPREPFFSLYHKKTSGEYRYICGLESFPSNWIIEKVVK